MTPGLIEPKTPDAAGPNAPGLIRQMSAGLRIKRAIPFALALGIWFFPVPAGLTPPAWHLFAVFAAAIASVLINAFPLLTASMLAVGAIVLTGTITPEQAYSGFANSSVLLVVIAFIVAQAVVKTGLGRRVSLFMVSRFGGSSLGLAYSIVLTDAAIAPAFPSNTARGGVLYPIVLAVAKGAGSEPGESDTRYLGGYLMFCSMAGLSVSSALWMTATSANPIAVQIVDQAGLQIDFGRWLLASAVPSLTAILLLPLIVAKLFPPRVGKTPEAPAAARHELAGMGRLSREEWITAGTFVLMVAGWIFGNKLHLNTTSVAFMGFGVLLFLNVITVDDITRQGDTLVTFFWLAVLFAMSAQLNELGFMGYVGERLASGLSGLSWMTLYLTLVVLYVLIHYMFVSQTSQVLALFGVFLDVGTKGGVPLPLMAFGLLFASSYFSVITPQGGSQNIIFAASGYLTQRELYRLGAVVTLAFLTIYLVIGSPWVYFVMR
jgi:DASS family divalent anion:Na+ symporter